MLNKIMLNIEEVLTIVDLKVGYGTDSYSQKVFKTLDKNDKRLHLVPSKAMRRYIEGYIKRKFKEENNKPPKTDKEKDTIIKREGATKGQMYEKKGILLMLEDEKINELVQERLKENAYLFENYKGEAVIVPNLVRKYYIEKTNGRFEDVEKAEYYAEIKDDPTDTLKMKLFIIQQEINNREAFEKMILEHDELAEHRSPESLD